MSPSPIFDETYQNYLSQITSLDLEAIQAKLGIDVEGDRAIVPFFNTTYTVSTGGIYNNQGNTPPLSICVVLCKYLLMCPDTIPNAVQLAAFKDFKDAAPLIHFFKNSVEGEVVRNFCGNVPALDSACLTLGGLPYRGELAYQVKYRFMGLPQVALYLFYNDAEEGFAAQCSILFERRASVFLDMESLAMLGGALSHMLVSERK